MSQASDTMRREWKINDAKRDAGLTTPDDIQRFDDIQYGRIRWKTNWMYTVQRIHRKNPGYRECAWRWMGIR